MLTTPPEVALPDPQKCANFYGEFQVKYPLRQSLVTIPCGPTFKALSEFRAILNDISLGCFTKTKSDERTASTILQAWPLLGRWYAQLPDDLDSRNISFPHELKVQ
jgi:hypothetical protein